MVILTKLQAAHNQLVTAVRLYFFDGDIASVHTLACAAREIYEKHLAASGRERMFDFIKVANPEKTPKQLWEILNGARNFLKHPEPSFDFDARIELDDETNAAAIFIATHDCAILCADEAPMEVQIFNLWFLAAKFPIPDETTAEDVPESEEAKGILRLIDQAFPGLRGAPAAEQKRMGRDLLAHGVDGIWPPRG